MRLCRALAALFVLIAILRIVSTYREFNHSADEGHFAAGLEYLADGTYTYEWQHPPLARLLLALPLYLEGVRPSHDPNLWHEANALLGHDPTNPLYWRRLILIRLMVLPWFVLCCWAIYQFAWECFGEITACTSVGLFTLLPPVLGHSGIATLDAAAMSSMFLAAYALWRVYLCGGVFRAVIAGIAVGVALLVKFSALVFLPVIAMAGLAYAIYERDGISPRSGLRFDLLAVSAFVAFFLIAVVYRGAMYQFWGGIGQVIHHNSSGHESWLLGKYSTQGWWYFFPVVLGVKTPLGFLVLALIGLFSVRGARLFGVCALACLLVSMDSHLNLGVRHILIVYPFLSICAGAGLMTTVSLVRASHAYLRDFLLFVVVPPLLFAAVVLQSARSNPDYLSYFNELVPRGQESRFLAESDLDWGQDLWRARQILLPKLCASPEEVGSRRPASVCRAEPLYVNYFGSADPHDFFPQFEWLQAWKPVKGWIVVSEHVRTIESARVVRNSGLETFGKQVAGPLEWLDQYQPVAMAGKSIRIYHIE